MARAVIKFSGGISSYMPQMHNNIKGCAYNPTSHVVAFRYDEMRVVIERSKVTLYGADNNNTVAKFMEWFIDKLDDTR